jgi:hypothetical protein
MGQMPAKKSPLGPLTPERLRSVLSYDPLTGLFTNRVDRGNRSRAGHIAGSTRKDGYIEVAVDGRPYLGHRLAWFYMNGEWPPGRLDHKDLKRGNNKWKNLRLATPAQNLQNIGVSAHNTTGRKGVSWHKASRRYRASIRANGKQIHLGNFDTIEEAAAAYATAAQIYFGEFVRLS